MSPKEVTPEMHDEFYRFISNSYDRSRFQLHYTADIPLSIRCLLYFPEGKPGMFNLVLWDIFPNDMSTYCYLCIKFLIASFVGIIVECQMSYFSDFVLNTLLKVTPASRMDAFTAFNHEI